MRFDSIIVFGLGAAGANLLLNLIHTVPEANIYGVDMDKVEPRNYLAGTQPYLKTHVGKFKTQVMQMLAMQQGKTLQVFNKEIKDISDIHGIIQSIKSDSILIIDAFDNAPSRDLFYKLSEKIWYKKYSEVLHLGFSANMSGEVMWDSSWEPMVTYKESTDICTLPGVRSFIMAITAIASMVINDYYFYDNKYSIYFDKYMKLRKI